MKSAMRNWISGTRLRRALGIRIGLLYQYPARPIPACSEPPADDRNLPTITIVTPSLNQGGFIGATVSSVLSQSYPRLQYIVQDGGSTDSTLDVLRSFPDRSFELYKERDAGQADAINKGFAHATGEVLAYLNADDILLDGALHTVGRFFRDNPDVDVVYGNRLVIDEAGREIGRWLLPGHMPTLLRHVDYVPQETLFWRARTMPAQEPPFDASLEFALDWAFLLRLLDSGARFAHIPRLLGGFRVHPTQKTQAQLASRGRHEMAQLRRKYATGRLPKLSGMVAHGLFLGRHWILERRYSRDAAKNNRGIGARNIETADDV